MGTVIYSSFFAVGAKFSHKFTDRSGSDLVNRLVSFLVLYHKVNFFSCHILDANGKAAFLLNRPFPVHLCYIHSDAAFHLDFQWFFIFIVGSVLQRCSGYCPASKTYCIFLGCKNLGIQKELRPALLPGNFQNIGLIPQTSLLSIYSINLNNLMLLQIFRQG